MIARPVYRRSFRPIVSLTAYGALALVAAGCSKKVAPRSPSVPVTAVLVEQRAVPFVLAASGTVEPLERVNIEGQVTGQLLRIRFREGDEVTKGQVLFELDSRPFRAQLEQARAVLAKDLAQWENANRDVERYATLVKQEYVTTQQYESVRATAAALRGTVQADSADVEAANLNLQYASIRAPISGRAGGLLIREGNLVRGPGTTLVTINQIRPILVRFTVPADRLTEIRRHPMKDVEISAAPPGVERGETGRLSFIDNTVDSTTGTILLKGTFTNGDGALWPGQFVSVAMQLYVQKDAVVVPAVAVTTGQQGASVFVIDSAKTVATRKVTVERVVGDLAVIASGLKVGEQVVTDGQLRLTPGAKVEIKTPAVRAPQEAS